VGEEVPMSKRTPTIILMEGPDACGKSTIGKALAEEICIPYFKVSTEHRNWKEKDSFMNALRYDQTYLVELLQQTRQDIIVDRAYPSEWVYSKVFKRATHESLLVDIDKAFAQIGTTIVVCTRFVPVDTYDDAIIPVGKFEELRITYDKFIEWTACNVIRMNVDHFTKEDGSWDTKAQVDAIVDAMWGCGPGSKARVTL
jgi:adenylate kinase family enzyme